MEPEDGQLGNLSSKMDELFSSVLVATKASNGLGVQHEDLQSFPEWQAKEEGVANQIRSLLQLLRHHVDNGAAAALENDDDDDDDWGLLDVTDAEMFEPYADTSEELLDEVQKFLAAGTEKAADAFVAKLGRFQRRQSTTGSVAAMSKLPKTQAMPGFKHHAAAPPDNSRATLFVDHPWDGRMTSHSEHPFAEETDQVGKLPINEPITPRTMPGPLRTQDLLVGDGSAGWLWVDTEETLGLLGEALRAEDAAVAIDLEHHSFRTFQGLTCLIQISCSRGDFIVDTLSPAVRPLLGATLGPVLSDAAVVKVLHGANMDCLWLARDFGLYVVNLFDTGQAARQLEYPSASLAYLLQRHANLTDIDEMKGKYQLSDWRVRPLETDQLRYARSDTHYLLAIYDRLKLELWNKNGVEAIQKVVDLSTAVSRQRFTKDIFDPEGWRKSPMGTSNLSADQQHRAQLLWDWRDMTARREDESPAFVLPQKVMPKIVTAPVMTAATLEELTRHANGGYGCPLVMAASAEIEELCSAVAGKPILAQYSPITNPAAIRRLRTSSSPFTFTPASSAASTALSTPGHSKITESPSPQNLYSLQNPQSPVLETEELYRTAGWVSRLSAADEDGEDDESSSKDGVAAADRIRRDIEERPFEPLVTAAFQAAVAVHPCGEEDSDAGPAILEPKLKPNSQLLIDGTEEEDNHVEAEEFDGNGAEAVSSIEEEGIPRSMSDIYKISNRNRRRNKEKKKMRESQPGKEDPPLSVTSAEQFDYFTSRDDKRQKGNKESDETAIEFMQEVGWASASNKGALLAGSSAVGHFNDTAEGEPRAESNPYLVDDE